MEEETLRIFQTLQNELNRTRSVAALAFIQVQAMKTLLTSEQKREVKTVLAAMAERQGAVETLAELTALDAETIKRRILLLAATAEADRIPGSLN
jgi:hypothetical protein